MNKQKVNSSSVKGDLSESTTSVINCSKPVRAFGFSEVNVNKAFKNLLRNANENNEYKEHKTMPFRERESKQRQESSLFDDTYKKSDDSFLNQQKFTNNYVKGNLKTNIKFSEDSSDLTPQEDKHSRVRLRSEIFNKHSDLIKCTSTGEDFSQKEIKDPIKKKFINDTFNKNPIQILSKEQTHDMVKNQKDKTQAKFQRVSNYLGSEGFKSAIVNDTSSNLNVANDKITSSSMTAAKNYIKSSEPKKVHKKLDHTFDNKRVFLV